MFYMTDKEYKHKLKEIEKRNDTHRKKEALENAKYKKKSKLPSTTKLITLYLFVLLNIILAYSLVAMWVFKDLSYLGALITDVIGQILVFFIYSQKSAKENTQGGIVYETTMAKLNQNNNITIETDNMV